jgi:hypothetical protein
VSCVDFVCINYRIEHSTLQAGLQSAKATLTEEASPAPLNITERR